MAGGRFRGGICGLLDLIEEHRGALRYDWRTRFGRGLDESVPADIGWDEALDLVRILRSDPSSRIAAAAEGWDQPHAPGDLIAMRQFELTQAAAGVKKPQPYPTAPWASKNTSTQRFGKTDGRSREEVVAILRAHGHELS